MVLDAQTGQPIGIITEADIAHTVADGKDVNSTRIGALMTARPTVINTTTSVRDAAMGVLNGTRLASARRGAAQHSHRSSRRAVGTGQQTQR